MNKFLRILTAYIFLLSTLSFVYTPKAQGFAASGFGSLVIGCVGGPQNGLIAPATQDSFAGCTVNVYVHNTSTLAGIYTAAAGTTAQTNPIVLTLGAGTVTTSGTTVTGVTGTTFPTTGAWIGQTINIGGVGYTISAVSNGTSLTTTQTLVTFSTAVSYTVRPQTTTFYAADGSYDICVTNALSIPVLSSACNYGLVIYQGNFTANKAMITTAFTDANSAALQAITGLSIPIPSTFVGNLNFHCALGYSQATPIAGDQFGIALLTTAPTRIDGVALVATNVTTTQYGLITNLTTTTPTAMVTFTPVPTTVLTAYLDGTVQVAGGGASTLQFYVLNGTAADVIVVAAGSYCTAF
jgi:hypothetical protein